MDLDAYDEEAKQSRQVEDLKRENRKLARRLSDARDAKVSLEQIIAESARAAFTAQKLPRPSAPRKDRRKKPSEVAVVMAADWQLGKVTPDYDSETCEARIIKYAEKVAMFTDLHRASHVVDTAHVWVLGDIVEGEKIFPGQEYLIDSGLIEQVVGNGSRILRDFLYSMLELFPKVHVTAVVGNHGRVGRRGEFHPNTNMDRMLYLVTEQWFQAAGEKRITWDIPTYEKGDRGWYAVDRIGDYSCLLIHGDQFRGGGGIAGLPYPSMAKKVLHWRDLAQAGEMPAFSDVACGHWHTNASIPEGTNMLRIAGSPESYNVWSQEFLAKSQAPSQRMMFVSPERGMVTSEQTIWL